MLNLNINFSILNLHAIAANVQRCLATGQYVWLASECAKPREYMYDWGLFRKERIDKRMRLVFDQEACVEFQALWEEAKRASEAKQKPKEEYKSPLPPLSLMEWSPQHEVRMSLRNGKARKWPN